MGLARQAYCMCYALSCMPTRVVYLSPPGLNVFFYEINFLSNYFRDMFKYNHEVHDIGTRSHDQLHLYPTRTSGARNVLQHHIPELLNTFPPNLIDKIKTHSLYSISHHIKCYLIDLYSYDCSIIDCYICNNI